MSETIRSKGIAAHIGAVWVLSCVVFCSVCSAVTSKITRQSTSAELLKGQTENIIIGSRGTISLGRASEVLVEQFENVWSINSVVASGGTVYVGTSPNGGIYKYSLGKLTKLYPAEDQGEPNDNDQPQDANTVEAEAVLTNEHIFAMAMDVAGRLLAGISGKRCRLIRFEGDKTEVVFEPKDARYIYAIALDAGGNIYLGTGPEGKVYQTDPFGKKAKVIYDSRDKNILSLAAGKNALYAGADGRGLVFRINPGAGSATVLYDSDQPEITALLLSKDGDLCAAATSAKVVQTQKQFAAQLPSSGRPDTQQAEGDKTAQNQGGRRLEIANTDKPKSTSTAARATPIRKGAATTQASHIYRISEEGFVTDLFSENAVFFCLAEQDELLLVGTGNNAQLFTVEPASEVKAVVYEDEQAAQITAIASADNEVYLGTANPAKLVKLGTGYAAEGTYISDLIDAGQPAKWGKLQIEAEIPDGCKVFVCSRSGNVKDVNDPTFSAWTEPLEVTGPVQLRCPLGRFCQYKLTLQNKAGDKTPVIREVAVASTVPNLAPTVTSVEVSRVTTAGKKGHFKITCKARDDNKDKLTFKIEFRKVGRTGWIELKDDLEVPSFEWDGRTVEDGRYEIRVTASDLKSNTSTTKLSGSRISDPVVVDNTGPVIGDVEVSAVVDKNGPCRVFKFAVSDRLSAIGKVEYTIDSNADWTGTLPDDSVYDTTEESFTISLDTKNDLGRGDHVLTIKAVDALGNTTYRTLDVTVGQ